MQGGDVAGQAYPISSVQGVYAAFQAGPSSTVQGDFTHIPTQASQANDSEWAFLWACLKFRKNLCLTTMVVIKSL
jgi:hypothetical protein